MSLIDSVYEFKKEIDLEYDYFVNTLMKNNGKNKENGKSQMDIVLESNLLLKLIFSQQNLITVTFLIINKKGSMGNCP